MRRAIPLLITLLLTAGAGSAEVRLPALFSDHMVLQRDGPAPIWGRADPGEQVSARLGNKRLRTTADETGRWQVTFEGLRRGGPHTLTIKGRRGPPIVIKDVLVGEVWICSGQSNMAWPVSRSRDAEREIANARYPAIRLITVPRKSSSKPQIHFAGRWAACDPKTVGSFSAVGYFFGRALSRRLKAPIGLINTSYGGTRVEAWTRRAALEADERFESFLGGWESRVAGDAAGKLAEDRHRPGNLYNAMIAPLVPYGIRGVIWYQGESNASRAEQYRALFPALIRNWREDWGQGDFPFYFVQLANFRKRLQKPAPSAWAELREAQRMTLSDVPNTGQAVTIDIGEAADIHPGNKQDVGERLARWALAKDYGKKIPFSGPTYESHEKREGEIAIRFGHAEGGLRTADGDPPTGFAVAGEDRKFAWARARIEDGTVVVASPEVPLPVAVRYAWGDNPACNLVNRAGLPASPFRTDTWPGITAGKE